MARGKRGSIDAAARENYHANADSCVLERWQSGRMPALEMPYTLTSVSRVRIPSSPFPVSTYGKSEGSILSVSRVVCYVNCYVKPRFTPSESHPRAPRQRSCKIPASF